MMRPSASVCLSLVRAADAAPESTARAASFQLSGATLRYAPAPAPPVYLSAHRRPPSVTESVNGAPFPVRASLPQRRRRPSGGAPTSGALGRHGRDCDRPAPAKGCVY